MRRARLSDVIGGLRRARRDPRVKGLIVKIGGQPLGLALVQEIRNAVVHFRAAGKLTVAWADSYGEVANGTVPYYLASAFEKVYLQPSGDVGLTGVAIEQRFLKGALGKLDIDYQVGQRHQYKTAANMFTQDHMTDAHKEMTGRLAESLTEQLVAGIAEGRGLEPKQVRELIDQGPFYGQEAMAAGLVDGLKYRDEVYAEHVPEDSLLLYVARYAKAQLPKMPHPGEQVVALGPRPRRDPAGPQRPLAAGRRQRDGLRHDQRGDARGPPRRQGPGDRVPGRQPRRLLHRLRLDLARGDPGQAGGQAGHRVDGRRRRLGRLLRLDGRRRHLRPARAR